MYSLRTLAQIKVYRVHLAMFAGAVYRAIYLQILLYVLFRMFVCVMPVV